MMRFKDRYEFHADNKQLLILFLGLLLLEVFVFLMGYFAGQGIPQRQAAVAGGPDERNLATEEIPATASKSETYSFYETLEEDSPPTDFEPIVAEPEKSATAKLELAPAKAAEPAKPEAATSPPSREASQSERGKRSAATSPPSRDTSKASQSERGKRSAATSPPSRDTSKASQSERGKTPAGRPGYVVQVSSTSSEPRAKELAARLKKKGFDASYNRADLGPKGIWFRIVLGPYPTREEAGRIEKQLESKEKFNAYVRKQ